MKRPWHAWLLFAAAWICGVSPVVHAEETTSKVRVHLEAPPKTWVGQKVVLVVELLAPGYFSGAPVFDLPQVPGALILPPEETPVLSTEEAGGVSYTVQRHELMVFARRAGPVKVPSLEVRFAIKRAPLDKNPVPQSVRTTEVAFEALQPPGTKPSENVVTSTDLQVTESWKPVPGTQAKAGDAFVRTVTWTASDVPGMAFAPLFEKDIPVLGIYPGTPRVNDHAGRGSMHGERIDTVTYVCKRGGTAVIPERVVRWWDPVAEQIRSVTFPARSFTILAPVEKSAATPERFPWALSGACVLAALAAACAFRFRRTLARVLRPLAPRHLVPLNPPAERRGSEG